MNFNVLLVLINLQEIFYCSAIFFSDPDPPYVCGLIGGTFSYEAYSCFVRGTELTSSAIGISSGQGYNLCYNIVQSQLNSYSWLLPPDMYLRGRLAVISSQAVLDEIDGQQDGRLAYTAMLPGSSDLQNRWCWVDGFGNPFSTTSWLPAGPISGSGDCMALQGSSFVRIDCEASTSTDSYLNPLCEVVDFSPSGMDPDCVAAQVPPTTTTESSGLSCGAPSVSLQYSQLLQPLESSYPEGSIFFHVCEGMCEFPDLNGGVAKGYKCKNGTWERVGPPCEGSL